MILFSVASARNLQLMAASKGVSGQGGDSMSLVKMKGEQTRRVELLLLLEGDFRDDISTSAGILNCLHGRVLSNISTVIP